MAVNAPKTEAMHVREDEHAYTGVTEAEAAAVTSTYEHTCEYCPGKAFKTKMGLGAHQRLLCTQAQEVAAVTKTTYRINKLVDCRGPPAI